MSERNNIIIASKLPDEIYSTIQEFYVDTPCPPVDMLPNCLVAIYKGDIVAVMFISLISTTCIAQIESVVTKPGHRLARFKYEALNLLLKEAEIFAQANGKTVVRSFVNHPSLRNGMKKQGYIEETESLHQLNKLL